MCFKKPDKWKSFEPTPKYLAEVSKLDTVEKLYEFTKWFTFTADVKDTWKTPVEMLSDGEGDCEDMARWYVDILVRIIGINEARFVECYGYNSKKKFTGHAICIFPYQGFLAVFTNNVQIRTGYSDFIEIGKTFFSNGLKKMIIRDWQGKIVERKHKLIGTF